MKPLCQIDCAGLCPQCGTNRNVSSCACVLDAADERFAALRALLTNRFPRNRKETPPVPPLPKRRTAKARQGDRRSHLALRPPSVGRMHPVSRDAPSPPGLSQLRTYKGEQVLKVNKTP